MMNKGCEVHLLVCLALSASLTGPTAVLPFQLLPVNAPVKAAEGGPNAWAPVTHIGKPK